MYVIGIGPTGTGTTSLAKFLRNLGFSAKNFCIIHGNRENDFIEKEEKNFWLKIQHLEILNKS